MSTTKRPRQESTVGQENLIETSILKIADSMINCEKRMAYGDPMENFQATADILRVLVRIRYGVDIQITPDFVGLFMAIAVKGARAAYRPTEDTLTDAAGYIGLVQQIVDRRNDERNPNV